MNLLDSNEMAEKTKPNRRLNYKETSDIHKAESLSQDIDNRITALKSVVKNGRVDLRDFEQVQKRTFSYLESCKKAQAFPSVLGLAAFGFGMSRQGLNRFLRDHPDLPSAQFIETTKDIFADILVNQSLYRNCDVTQVIFQLKNCNGFSDKLEIEAAKPVNPLGELMDQKQLEEMIDSLPEPDEEEF